MRELVHICETGGIILDPFAGSGSTLAAAILEGFDVIGIEKDAYYFGLSRKRMLEAMKMRFLRGLKDV
jgi:site-specific DNA-methyltransferase (adenine-specific)